MCIHLCTHIYECMCAYVTYIIYLLYFMPNVYFVNSLENLCVPEVAYEML